MKKFDNVKCQDPVTFFPAASLPSYVNGNIVIVNIEETPLDSTALLVINDKLGNVFFRFGKGI